MVESTKFKISAVLSSFSFVRWDRYCPDEEVHQYTFYGWIDREDAYKDFLVLDYDEKKDYWWWVTSSAKYDAEIKRLFKEEDEGIACQRIEHDFDILNSIKIGK